MAVQVEQRGKHREWLTYRVCWDGWKSREPTGLRATPKNREKVERKARLMSELMAEGRFDYLAWFPDGNRAHLYRPSAPAPTLDMPTYSEFATETWLPSKQPPLVRATLTKTYSKHLRNHILPAVGGRALPSLALADLENLRDLMVRAVHAGGKGLTVKTARDVIGGTFRALYRDARKRGLVSGDPFADLPSRQSAMSGR